MNLECLNGIITDNLAIHIDLTNIRSWDLNSGLTTISLTKWNKAISDDIELLDFGLTGFDNGRLNSMNTGITLTQNDNKLKLYRVGYNTNSGGTFYTGYTVTSISGSSVGRYFALTGGFLQGFFKLEDYNYELLSPRYNKGITIETIVEILPQTMGIFYYMGTRAEDKYCPFFSGETRITGTTGITYGGKYTGYTYQFTGITTSVGNYLNSYDENTVKKSAFPQPEFSDVVIMDEIEQLNNINNNLISFEITDEKKIKYKYIDVNGSLIQNESPNAISRVGWTIIDIVFKPYDIINGYNPLLYQCYPRRKGDLIIYINGRRFWKVVDFDEFYFRGLTTGKEKQLGVPYNITWGGGSFGLKHSWHYNNFDKNQLIQDSSKNELFIEKYFNSPFIGNIQKLRVYDIALESNEVLHNAFIESTNNTNYGILISKGGRIINRYENVPYIPQQSSGSDIRKSIRYRNSDGTYKDLYQMLDIKVVIKSRSNTSVELVKFKKNADIGWLGLIYVNDTTYDFIVPDTITALHPNETLFAEIKFQWTDPLDIDNVLDKIFVINITTANLIDNSVKNY